MRIFVLLFLFSFPCFSQSITGKVVGIMDGDTFKLLTADSTLINIARNAQPGADSELTGGTVAAAAENSKFVVEINGGLAEKWGLEEGKTKIRWKK